MNLPGRIKDVIKAACRTGSGGSEWTPVDERIFSDASAAMRQTHINNQRVTRINVWRKIMESKMTRYSAAAVVALAAALILVSPFGTSKHGGVLLADVQERIAQADTMVLRGETTFTSISDPNITVTFDNVKYMSRDHGFVEDGFVKGALFYRVVLNRQEKQSLLLLAPWKKCLRFPCTEDQIKVMEKLTPTGVVDLLLQTDHKELGISQIEGVEAEGFEVQDLQPLENVVPKFLLDIQQGTATIWVGTKELLPVRMEADMRIGKGFLTGFRDLRCHEIAILDSYDVELDPGLFDTSIPEGYTEFKVTDLIPAKLSLGALGILPAGYLIRRRAKGGKAICTPTP